MALPIIQRRACGDPGRRHTHRAAARSTKMTPPEESRCETRAVTVAESSALAAWAFGCVGASLRRPQFRTTRLRRPWIAVDAPGPPVPAASLRRLGHVGAGPLSLLGRVP